MSPSRVMAMLLCGLVLVLPSGACGGDDDTAPATSFTPADAVRLAEVRPATPGWPAWPQSPEPKTPSGRTPEEVAAEDPIYAEYRRKTADLAGSEDDDNGSSNKWMDDDKLANLVTGVFASAEDAHVGFLASNDLSQGYGEKFGSVTRAEPVDDLGDEAWRLWVSGNGAQVTYHWRRNNLFVEVHVHCYGACPSDVDDAARAWADAVDEEARSGS